MDVNHGGTDGRKGGMMGKYIIEIPDDMIVSRELPTLAIKARFGNMRQFALDTGLKLMPYDDAEQRGADKAWELARWCFKDASDSDIKMAFPFEWNHGGYRRIADMPYIQVAGRYEEWMKQAEEIKVGDEVTNGYSTAVVLYTNGQRVGLFFNSGINSGIAQETYKKDWKKTGRHSPELVEALERLKEK